MNARTTPDGQRQLPGLSGLVVMLTLLSFAAPSVRAQSGTGGAFETGHGTATASDNEIDIELWHKALGSVTLPALLRNDQVYVVPTDVFGFVHVRADASSDGRTVTGYYIDENRRYTIDANARSITYLDKTYSLTADEFVVRSSGAYLRTDVFQRIFNLTLTFAFRSLAVEISSPDQLPAVADLAYEKQRKGAQGFEDDQEMKADRTLPLERSVLGAGVLDYSASYSYEQGHAAGEKPIDYTLLFGGRLLGGDFDASLASQSRQRIDWSQTPWQWRYALAPNALLTRIVVGRRAPLFTNFSLPDSMVGVQFSNVASQESRTFASYTISDRTEPDWTVELYVNDALVNYTKADQTGYYHFTIPLTYGSTNLKLKFYGPYGEVRTRTLDFQIPYTFLAPGHVEYTLSAGTSMVNPSPKNAVSQLDMKFGVSTGISLTGGVRVSSDEITGLSYMPYASTSMTPFDGLLCGGDFYYGMGYKASMSYSTRWGLSLDAEYDRRMPGRTDSLAGGAGSSALSLFRVTDLRKLTLSTPLFGSASLRCTASEIPRLDTANAGTMAVTAEMLFTLWGISTNISANAGFDRYGLVPTRDLSVIRRGDITGDAGLSFTVFGTTVVRPSISVNYSQQTFSTGQITVSRSIGEWASINLSAMHNFGLGEHVTSVQLGLRTTLPTVQLGATASGATADQPIGVTTSLQGSLAIDPSSPDLVRALVMTNRPQVRRAAIEIVPFSDTNNNGRWDRGEPLIPHFGLERAPGRVEESSDGLLRIFDLEPYKRYVLKSSTAELENISLMPAFQSIAVTPAANGVLRVDIPLATAGQIEGYVMKAVPSKEHATPIGTDTATETATIKTEALGGARILLSRIDGSDTELVKLSEDLLSYSNGEFFYMGLPPGHYSATIDPAQLAILHATVTPPAISFQIRSTQDGDFVSGLNFTIKPSATESKETLAKQ